MSCSGTCLIIWKCRIIGKYLIIETHLNIPSFTLKEPSITLTIPAISLTLYQNTIPSITLTVPSLGQAGAGGVRAGASRLPVRGRGRYRTQKAPHVIPSLSHSLSQKNQPTPPTSLSPAGWSYDPEVCVITADR